jgi:hypothetical protein
MGARSDARIDGPSLVDAFVILASAAIMPTTPRKMLAASLLAASLEPLGVWWAHLRGIAVPGIVETLALTMPNYVGALVATVPSQVFQGLGRRLREAQDSAAINSRNSSAAAAWAKCGERSIAGSYVTPRSN